MPAHKTLFAALLALSLAACGAATPEPVGEPPLAGATIGGEFELTGETGDTVRWSDFNGQYRIVYFGYAYCPDICPTDVQRAMAGLKQFEQVEPQLGAQIQPLFITIDPERDTQEVVEEFTANFHPRLIGLTGTAEQIEAAADTFKVFYSRGEDQPGGGYLMDHSNITYLFGPDGEPIATLPTDLGPDAIATEIAKWVR
ncbi:SCO family protein [Parerythrobacter jejuensis]|uniref:SCO family protein n=1 Tax=Parerythrobacter jejuensis TaxID=795812 RepID=A0A845AR94_9SPHN|nr:SCO family protein [Parerythrobacter jejuensis]MXP31371.1 SCO family protein [Parerythrobacter jejuensis]MXP34131.1 SCO family protein [Parerythrobacter jejuensis]